MVGAFLVVAVSILNLIALEIGPLGSPWPIALLWPICGWAGLGPNVTTASLLFGLGLWVDILTGAPLGTWAFIALVSHGVILTLARFVGTRSLGRLSNGVIASIAMAITMILFGLWRDTGFYVVGSILPLVTAVIFYHFFGKVFELAEDET